jgi:hypothetical protein
MKSKYLCMVLYIAKNSGEIISSYLTNEVI